MPVNRILCIITLAAKSCNAELKVSSDVDDEKNGKRDHAKRGHPQN